MPAVATKLSLRAHVIVAALDHRRLSDLVVPRHSAERDGALRCRLSKRSELHGSMHVTFVVPLSSWHRRVASDE